MMRSTSALRALTRAAQQPMAARAFSSSATASFAQPAQTEAPAAGKAPKIKEFKIYRWVSMSCKGRHVGARSSRRREKYGERRAQERCRGMTRVGSRVAACLHARSPPGLMQPAPMPIAYS